jgi:hypothetical protein
MKRDLKGLATKIFVYLNRKDNENKKFSDLKEEINDLIEDEERRTRYNNNFLLSNDQKLDIYNSTKIMSYIEEEDKIVKESLNNLILNKKLKKMKIKNVNYILVSIPTQRNKSLYNIFLIKRNDGENIFDNIEIETDYRVVAILYDSKFSEFGPIIKTSNEETLMIEYHKLKPSLIGGYIPIIKFYDLSKLDTDKSIKEIPIDNIKLKILIYNRFNWKNSIFELKGFDSTTHYDIKYHTNIDYNKEEHIICLRRQEKILSLPKMTTTTWED